MICNKGAEPWLIATGEAPFYCQNGETDGLSVSFSILTIKRCYMLGAGKSYLVHDEIDTLEEVYRKVSAVKAEQIMEVAEEIFSKTSTLIYQ